jgi:hypothetical protein
MAEIFLSYRRQDSASATGRLADRLEEHFGPARVFRDHDSIVAGDDFAAAIRRAIEASTVLLVVIGPDWVDATLPGGLRRLDDPADWVRLEIEFAFAANLPVLPVLVEGARMPTAEQLPDSLAALARCQALELSDTRWRYDAERLIETLQARFAIEALGALPGGRTHGGTLGAAARLALDLLDLAMHPTRLIARRQTGRAIDHIRAFLFLVGALLVGSLALLIGLNVHPSPSAIGGPLGGVAAWLLSGELIGLILVTLLAAPLFVAWRAVGRRIEFRQVTLIGAYLYGGTWLGFCGGALILGFGFQLVDATLFDRAVALLAGSGAPLTAARVAQASDLIAAALRGPAAALLPFALLTWVLTFVWVIVAWGAFRQAYGASRVQAALATAAWLALLTILVSTAAWLAA